MEYVTIGLLVAVLGTQLGTFKWLIDRINDVRKELTKMHTNDLYHIELKIDDINEKLTKHRLEDH